MSKNDHQYWFKRRRYGYGWTPVTWKGWMVVIVFLGTMLVNAAIMVVVPYSNENLWFYLNTLMTALAALFIITRLKAPAPKWRWGKKHSDNKHEDF